MAKKTGSNEASKEYIVMATLEEQEAKIEALRIRLHNLVLAKAGNMIDPEVGELSTKLDKLIVKYQKTKEKATK